MDTKLGEGFAFFRWVVLQMRAAGFRSLARPCWCPSCERRRNNIWKSPDKWLYR